jgi:hypothetical protein
MRSIDPLVSSIKRTFGSGGLVSICPCASARPAAQRRAAPAEAAQDHVANVLGSILEALIACLLTAEYQDESDPR